MPHIVRPGEKTVIERAREIPIFDVLRDVFGINHPRDGRSYKGYCPYGFEHPDGGADKGWRTYPATNSSFCFVMHGPMDAIKLIQIRNDWKPGRAAHWLLEEYGLAAPRNYRERYAEVVRERETRMAGMGDPAYVVEALHLSLSDDKMLFDTRVAGVMEEELERLDGLLAAYPTEDDVRAWYQQARERLRTIANG